MEVSQAASDFRGFPHRVVEILEVEDRGALVRGDEVQRSARRLSAGLGGLIISTHSLREAPGPNRQGRGGELSSGHFTQHPGDSLLFGGADVGEGASGLEKLAKNLRSPALDGKIVLRIGRRGTVGRDAACSLWRTLSLWTNPANKA